MYNTTADYKTYIKKPSRQFQCRITLGARVFDNDDIIQIVPNVVQPNNGFSIGNTISQSIDITLKNDNGVYASVGKIDAEIGLKIENSIEYIKIGTFNIDDVTKTDYTVKITAYDNMIKFETPYFSSLGNTPTLQQVIDELASITGVQFTGTVPNYTVTKLKGFTCREVLGYVASVCGGNAYITRDGKFTILYHKEVDCTVTADNYIGSGYKIEDQVYKIGMITCQNKNNTSSTNSEDYDSVNDENTISVGSLASDTMELTFENPWVTTSILNDIYNRLNGFSYLGYTMKWQGDLSLDPMDIVTVVDKNNVTRKALIFANKLKYTGGLTAETSAKGETKNSNSFNANGPSIKDIQRLSVQLLIAEKAIITKASIKDLQANSARIDDLQASVATIDTALINYATVTQLDAVKANVANLFAADATINNTLINKANIADLTATNATVANLNSDMANVKTLVNGNLTSANIQSLVLTSSKVTVDNGFIKNAMIESLDATKINTGSLNTGKVSVTSSDGSLLIAGATQQFKDKNGKVRIQMGQDAQGNFNFILVASDGTTTLIDGAGVKANAIADKLIKTNMVADSAIGEQQINYSSFVTGFNKSTNTSYINASKVSIDLTGQTLDISFNNLNTKVDGVKATTDNNTTSISAINGQISTLISNTTITKDGTTTQLKDAYNGTVATVNSIQTTISQHQTSIDTANSNITSINSNITSIQASLSSISASLSSTQSTVSTHTTQISTANSNIATINTNVSNVTSRVSTLEVTATSLTTRVGNTETAISNLSIGGRNLLINSNSCDCFVPCNYASANWVGTTIDATGETGITKKIRRAYRITGVGDFRVNASQNTGLVANRTFTFSVWIKSNISNTNLNVNFMLGGTTADENMTSGAIVTIYPDKWIRYTYTKTYASNTTSNSIRVYMKCDTNPCDILLSDAKLEEGNKVTDWTPAPEDVDSSIQSVKDYATTTINSNVSTINQTTTSIQAQVTSLQSSVSTINTTLGNKADTTTVTNVTNRVSTLESSVTGINASITTINSNVSSVTTTANNALSAINSLKIGGTNLLKNTSYANDISGTTNRGTYHTISRDATNIYNSNNSLKIVCSTISISGSQDVWQNAYDVFIVGKDIVISFYIKGSVATTGWIRLAGGSASAGMIGFNITTSWTKIEIYLGTVSGAGTAGSTVLIYGFNAVGTYYINSMKLEYGTKATDWTPAPEDVDSQITTINSSVTSLQSSVSVLQSQISLKVEQSNIDSAVTTINGQIASTNATISSLQSSINLQLDSITSKVNKTVSTKNLVNNSSFENVISISYSNNMAYGYTVPSATLSGWYSNMVGISNNVLFLRDDTVGDHYVEFNNIKASITAGKTYTVSYYYCGGGQYAGSSSYLYFCDSNGVYQSLIDLTPSVVPNHNAWIRYTKTFVAPTGIALAKFRFGFRSTVAGLTELFIDNIQIEEGSTATDWNESTQSIVGTSIIQSPTEVMTAFNNISSYFQVSADGAKFGNIASGDYTVMNSSGMKHHIASLDYDYLYVSYNGTVSFNAIGSFNSTVSVTIPPSILTMLNGRTPQIIAMITQANVSSSVITSSYITVNSYDSSTGTITFRATLYSYNITVATTVKNGYLGSYDATSKVSFEPGYNSVYGTITYMLTA